ncbi:cytochrome p450 family protein [Apiospora hydei]|uniref:Cytochrome p450 family protein n=1 Tax=Apiospora hydei TaxID=1337664 RepID=A0ABR1V9T9_9PEZI
MSAHNETAAAQAQGLLQSLSPWYSLALIPLLTLLALQPWRSSKEPPSLRAKIPYISNGYQFLADKATFFRRLDFFLSNAANEPYNRKAFRKASIIKFHIGWKTVYMVSGANNIQVLFRSGHGINDDSMVRTAAEVVWDMPPEDLAKLVDDRSGRNKVPKPGYEDMPFHKRYWAANHEIYENFLSNKEYSSASANKYFEVFAERLEKFPLGEWTTVSLTDVFMKDMTHGAITALMGSQILELNPGFVGHYWTFERYLVEFLAGLPKWLNPRPYRALENFKAMTTKWVESAWDNFDWDGPDADAAWDPHFGSRVMREISHWWKDNFAFKSQSGFFASLLLAQNSNTVPAAMWSVLRLIEDEELYRAVRAEVATTLVVDPATGARTLDPQALGALPLLNALYTETLRYHVTFNIMREVSEDTQMDGYDLKKGAWIQASTQIAHFDESLWARDGHPASEFWIGRFLEYEDKVIDEKSGRTERVPKFNGSTRPGSYFPYGGGAAMCPGRQFARLEILITVALLVSKFDIESLEWTFPDGRKSDRPGKPDESVMGSGVLRPDREMKVRWKRLW